MRDADDCKAQEARIAALEERVAKLEQMLDAAARAHNGLVQLLQDPDEFEHQMSGRNGH